MKLLHPLLSLLLLLFVDAHDPKSKEIDDDRVDEQKRTTQDSNLQPHPYKLRLLLLSSIGGVCSTFEPAVL